LEVHLSDGYIAAQHLILRQVTDVSESSAIVLYKSRSQSDPLGSELVFSLSNKLPETKMKAPMTIAISARLKAGQCQSLQ
jgi:hypothetical protein